MIGKGKKKVFLPGRCGASWDDESQAGHQEKEYGHYEAGHFCLLLLPAAQSVIRLGNR